MTIELTPEEKATIVEQHLKTILYSEYNTILSISESQAVATPNSAVISSLEEQLEDIISQKDILQAELESLQP